MTEQAVKEFWDNQAVEHGAEETATAPDRAYRKLEIESIVPWIKGPFVLDVGCGNGYSTFRFEEAYTNYRFTGVDYSEKMVLAAVAEAIHRHSNALFVTGDVRNLSTLVRQYDTIISERCLINLETWDEQKAAILEMKKCLAPKGRLILVENFVDGLGQLNQLRHKVGLHPIQVRWHNRYMLNGEFVPFINENFITLHHENIGNLFYIISRVVYAALCKEIGTEPQYENPINYIAAKLPTLGTYGYSPNMMYVLRAK